MGQSIDDMYSLCDGMNMNSRVVYFPHCVDEACGRLARVKALKCTRTLILAHQS